MEHLICTTKLNNAALDRIFKLADHYRRLKNSGRLKGKVVATIFYEPSTRTRLSFETAALRLGAQVISTENAAQFSSAAKGETIEDTIKIVAGYSDLIVLRHFQEGASALAAEISEVPIINAGDGTGEHPTQALLDLYTIKRELKRLNNLKIALVGDLLNGRTIHSLIHLLSLYKHNFLYLISPPQLKLPLTYKKFLSDNKIEFKETKNLTDSLKDIDILYMTRVQKERFKSKSDFQKVKDSYRLDTKLLTQLNPKAIIMHPLPRVNEIDKDVDIDSRAAYFRQAQNGLYVRMAILDLLIKK